MAYTDLDDKRAYDREWRRQQRARKKAEAEGKTFKYPIYPLIHGIDTPNNLNVFAVYTQSTEKKDDTKKQR